ncbi:hypothetical protein GCM10010492_68420 [Saccharothrix mutabilis subsp. mutabilis]|uniref:Lipoprotein n=1 Tax=Saccharothrix mutabilis subsp. mutabilis TaxID=66855 RepID=A0ABN0UPZ7_9PSEU
MKAIRPVLVAAVLGAGLVACTSTPQQAAPTTTSTTTATTTTTSTTTASPTAPPSAEPTVPPSAAPTVAPDREPATGKVADPTPVLDHGGFGVIRLGMSEEDLLATGLVTNDGTEQPGDCGFYRLASDTGAVFVRRDRGLGVVSIIVNGNVRTTEGIRPGSTTEEARATYPGFVDGPPWESADLGGGIRYGFGGRPIISQLLLFRHMENCHN